MSKWCGVLQTGDVDDALATVGNHILAGRHIEVRRHEYKIWPEEIEHARKFGHPLEHEAIEYEVYVEFEDDDRISRV